MRALLICAGGGIGDSLMASMCANALHRKYETVDALTLPAHADTLQHVPDFDEVLVDDGASISDLSKMLAERTYDSAVVTWATRRTAVLPTRARIPVRVGQANRLYSALFTHRVPVLSEYGDVITHWSQILLDFARALGCDSDLPHPRFVIGPDDREEAGDLLARRKIEEPFGIVHPTCSISSQRDQWPIEGWIALVRALQEYCEFPMVLSGATADAVSNAKIAAATGAISIAGECGIGAFAALAQEARFIAVMHSGPMHVAAAVGTPTIGIFPLQADFPDRWAPPGERVRVVRASFRCPPGERMETCPDYRCVRALPVTRIVAAVGGLRLRAGEKVA